MVLTAQGGQQFSFHRTDGSVIETAPEMYASDDWPDVAITPDAVVPISGGRLDVGYATEVLHAAWAWKAAPSATPDAA